MPPRVVEARRTFIESRLTSGKGPRSALPKPSVSKGTGLALDIEVLHNRIVMIHPTNDAESQNLYHLGDAIAEIVEHDRAPLYRLGNIDDLWSVVRRLVWSY